MRLIILLGGLALAAVLAVPMPVAAGGAAAISGSPIFTNPNLPAPPRVPPEKWLEFAARSPAS